MLQRDVDLIRWNPDPFEKMWRFDSDPIPLFTYGITGVLDVTASAVFGGAFGFFGDLDIGLSTRGLTQDEDGDGRPDGNLLNGFFIGDNRPAAPDEPDAFELGFQAEIYAGIQGAGRLLGFEIVTVGGEAGLRGTIGLDLADVIYDSPDPDAIEGMKRVGRIDVGGDNRIYLDEFQFLVNNYGYHCALTLGGQVDLFLRLKIKALGFEIYEGRVDIPIVSWEIPCGLTEDDLADVIDGPLGKTLVMHTDDSTDEKDIKVTLLKDQEGNLQKLRVSKRGEDTYLFDDFPLDDPADPDYIGDITLVALVLEGAAGNDKITVDQTVTQRIFTGTINSDPFENPVQIQRITVNAHAGDDRLEFGQVDSLGTFLTETYIDAGDGNDQIAGTPFADEIHAGPGDDTVTSYGGDDTIYGGDGQDVIDAGLGNDWVRGDEGDDTLISSGGQKLRCSAKAAMTRFTAASTETTSTAEMVPTRSGPPKETMMCMQAPATIRYSPAPVTTLSQASRAMTNCTAKKAETVFPDTRATTCSWADRATTSSGPAKATIRCTATTETTSSAPLTNSRTRRGKTPTSTGEGGDTMCWST